MTTPAFEHFLARLYTDADLRGRFLSEASATASAAGLAPDEIAALVLMDRTGLELAARSYALKREATARGDGGWLVKLLRTVRLR